MPKRLMPYLVKEIARGKVFWYVRVGKGTRARIHGEYGSDEFVKAYFAAVGGQEIAEQIEPRIVNIARYRRRKSPVGYIYFVAAGKHVKIGFARNVKSRIADIQVGHHEKLKLLHMEKGTMQDEAVFHALFSGLRYRGEWFHNAGDLADYIRDSQPKKRTKPPYTKNPNGHCEIKPV